jgi:hypothetical protein
MVQGLGWAARGGWRACSEGPRGAEAASRRLKRAVLAGQPDVNPSSPSSIGPVGSSGGQSAVACVPVAPVGFPAVEWTAAPSGWDARNHAMQMDSRASSREMVAPPGREPLIATVMHEDLCVC